MDVFISNICFFTNLYGRTSYIKITFLEKYKITCIINQLDIFYILIYRQKVGQYIDSVIVLCTFIWRTLLRLLDRFQGILSIKVISSSYK